MHVNTSYDAFKFNFKAKTLTIPVFEAARDKQYYIRSEAKFRHSTELVVRSYWYANYIDRGVIWFGDMNDICYVNFRNRMQNFYYEFGKDLKKLDMTFDELLTPVDGQLPAIITANIDKTIKPETLYAIEYLTGFSKIIECHDIIWETEKEVIAKRLPFVSPFLDRKKLKKVVLDVYQDV